MIKRGALQPLIDSLGQGLMAVDERLEIISMNEPAERMLGLDFGETRGRALSVVCPVLAPLAEECLLKAAPLSPVEVVLASNIFMVEARSIAGSETGVIFSISALPAPAGHDPAPQTIGLTIDQYESVFNVIEDGIWVADGQANVININRTAEEFIGVSPGTLVGRNIRSLIEEGAIDKAATLEVLATRKQVNLIQYTKSKGKQLLLTGTPLFDKEGRIELVVITERDVTQLNALNKELAQAQMMTERIRDELALVNTLQMNGQRLIAKSEEMLQVIQLAAKLSRLNDFNILILGESGTGKGLLARYIHENSTRKNHPLIQINCAALPETLLEAELFGYEKGAFTGAREQGKIGIIELAEGGTLFLDEIGDCPLPIQAKLLKYLDDHEIFRLGGTESIKVDCSILAATNQDLRVLVKNGRFRQDLFYRLNTFTLTIPPLRERPDDIIELIKYYLTKYNTRYALLGHISPDSMKLLYEYSFPGNIRELKSIVKKAVVISEDEALDGILMSNLTARKGGNDHLDLKEQVSRLERKILVESRQRYKTTRGMAAHLGLDQSTVARKLKKYGLS